MFAYINGILDSKTNNYVVVETGGVGYRIFMPSTAIEKLPEVGQKVKIHTYYYVREDNISLYGFNTLEERTMFELLLSVSGIGAKSAIVILSEVSPSKFALAVISNDVSSLVKVPGIGQKTAQRIILELKDKLKTEEAISKQEETILNKEENIGNGAIEEALSALQVLGYQKKEAQNALAKIDVNGASVEDLIKKALVILSK